MINLKGLKGKYTKANYTQKVAFLDPPSTSIQDIIGIRTNDTSSDISYPSTKYIPIKNLGDGSASTIFKGIDVITGENLIIKKICKKEHWRRELEILKKLKNTSSDRILKFIDFYESQRNSYIITEFYPGFDLFEHIDLNVPYPEEKGFKIITEMAKCIKECHDNQIVHLDIKFENYMVKTPYLFEKNQIQEIVLIDFGHAEMFKDSDSIEKLRRRYSYGTTYNLCPEGYYEKLYSSKSDIWSLAVCLSLLLTGDYPFKGSKQDYYNNSVNDNVCLSKDISEGSKQIIIQAIRADPEKRPNIDQFIDICEKQLKTLRTN